MGWKAPDRKFGSEIASPEFLGSLPKSRHKPGVRLPQHLARLPPEGMERWGWRLLRRLGPIERVLIQNGLDAERFNAFGFPLLTSCVVDLSEELCDPGAVRFRAQMLPARQLAQDDLLGRRVLSRIEILAPQPRSVLAGAVEPDSLDRGTGQERSGAMNAGPLLGLGDQEFFGAVRKNVLEARDLRLFLLADHDGLIAT